MPDDFHMLPRLRDSLSYLYIEHAVIEKKQTSLHVMQELGSTTVPIAGLCVLLLGPGTTITHAAISLLGQNGVSMVWCGEDGTHYYAQGNGETHKARHILRQVEFYSDPVKRLDVVLHMYEMRFGYRLDPALTIEQIRGMEGVRVRTAYEQASQQWNVEWKGRASDRSNWHAAHAINRALAAANAVLHALCHAAIVSGGYSPAIGFLHSGWHLAFVYDIADLYKTRLTVPVAFETVAESDQNVESRTRQACRERLREEKLLHHILPDIDCLLKVNEPLTAADAEDTIPDQPWWDLFNTQEVEHGDHDP